MTFSRDTLAAFVIAVFVTGGVWYAWDSNCNKWRLSFFKDGTAAKMSQVDVRQIEWSADGRGQDDKADHHNVVKGRVFGPDGKPFAGAKLYLGSHPRRSDGRALPKKVIYPLRAASGAEGKFELSLAKSEGDAGDLDDCRYQVLAIAEGYGCAWATVAPETEELTLRLIKDAPVGGRVLDLDGKPVAGAKLRVESLSDAKGDPASGWVGPLPGGQEVLSTGKDGRFELTGVGHERAVGLVLEGPGIVTTRFSASGTKVECRASVSRPVGGVVRDKDTGKPLAGASVSLYGGSPSGQAVTDREGRYELLGLAKASGYRLVAAAAERHLYFQRITQVKDAPGLGAMTVDFKLERGRVTVSGTVTDKATGKPVAGAEVNYFPLYPNQTAIRMELVSDPFTGTTTDWDGRYTVAVMTGPGVIGVTAPKGDQYMHAWVTTKEIQGFFKTPLVDPGGVKDYMAIAAGGQSARHLQQQDYHALVLLEPGEQDKALTRDLVLERAVERKGRIVNPDGQPLTGVTVWGLSPRTWGGNTLKGDQFTVRGINPKAPRTLAFLHGDKKLGFVLKESPDEKAGPLTVTLQPCGSVSGRVVDRDGHPLAGFRLDVSLKSFSSGPVGATTGKDGRFRAEGLVPGAEYTVWLPRQRGILCDTPAIEPGKDKDLGDIRGER